MYKSLSLETTREVYYNDFVWFSKCIYEMLVWLTIPQQITFLQILEKDLRWTSTLREACIILCFMILLQKKKAYFHSYRYLFVTTRLNMQFSHYTNNILENHKIYENATSTSICRVTVRMIVQAWFGFWKLQINDFTAAL